jgi:hypothetical protein
MPDLEQQAADRIGGVVHSAPALSRTQSVNGTGGQQASACTPRRPPPTQQLARPDLKASNSDQP